MSTHWDMDIAVEYAYEARFTVYITIHDHSDELTLREWAEYIHTVDDMLRPNHSGWWDVAAEVTHLGAWASPDKRSVCWLVGIACYQDAKETLSALKRQLASTAKNYRQDSFTWAEAEVMAIGSIG